jgi:hypothetical protein
LIDGNLKTLIFKKTDRESERECACFFNFESEEGKERGFTLYSVCKMGRVCGYLQWCILLTYFNFNLNFYLSICFYFLLTYLFQRIQNEVRINDKLQVHHSYYLQTHLFK